METLLSIITPVYNRADCLENCLKSVEAQLGILPVEHVVVDDGSTDGTWELLERYAASHPHTRAVRLDRNRGTNAARNAAVRAAAGKWLLNLDSDDTLSEGALAAVREGLDAFPEYRHLLFTVNYRVGKFAAEGIPPGTTKEFQYRDFLEERVSGDFVHVMLRDTMARYPFDEELRIYEGVFFMSFYKAAGRMMFINKGVVDVDLSRDDRVTYTLLPDNDTTLRRTVAAIDILLERFGEEKGATPAGRAAMARDLEKKYRFETFLGDRPAAARTAATMRGMGLAPQPLYRVLNATRLGRAFFLGGRYYVKLKFALGVRP